MVIAQQRPEGMREWRLKDPHNDNSSLPDSIVCIVRINSYFCLGWGVGTFREISGGIFQAKGTSVKILRQLCSKITSFPC